MRKSFVAALLFAPSLAIAQTSGPDHSNSPVMPGSWTHAAIAGGFEATFRNATGQPQLFLTCVRASRQVKIARPAAVASPMLQLWTSSLSRSLAASFDPATRRLSATLAAQDPLLDALAMSRGRIAVGVYGQAPVVAPPWGEISRVVEECRL